MSLQELTYYACPIIFVASGYALGCIITERRINNRRKARWINLTGVKF